MEIKNNDESFVRVKDCLSHIQFECGCIVRGSNRAIERANQIFIEAQEAHDTLVEIQEKFLAYKILFLWEAGELSEGQAMKRLNLDRVSLRVLRDNYLNSAE